jgi:hypothetical protein
MAVKSFIILALGSMEFITFDRGLCSLDRKDKVQYRRHDYQENDTQHNALNWDTVREMVNILCCNSYVVLLSAIRLNVNMTSVIRLSVFYSQCHGAPGTAKLRLARF